jgi:predicted Ser/Thr protein kinase
MADLQGKKIGEGQEAEIFLIENDKVVKLFKSDSYAEKSRRESELLSLLNANKVSAPMMHGQITMDAKPGYVMDYIPGYSLLAKLEANPLQCNKIARQFADIHVKVSGTKAPD